MGGMGFIENFRVECLRSILINTHLIEAAYRAGVERYFFSSSACAYNTDLQKTPEVIALKESDAYPAMAERGYGWEKLVSEMFCQEYWEERGLETAHRPLPQRLRSQRHLGRWPREGARRDVPQGHRGQGQRRHAHRDLGRRRADALLLYIDDCLNGIDLIMHSPELIATPINLGSSELVSINELVDIVEDIAGVKLEREYDLDAPKGVAGRNSDNTFIQEVLGWEPDTPLARRHGRDLRLDRAAVRRPQGRQARRRRLARAMTVPTKAPPTSASLQARDRQRLPTDCRWRVAGSTSPSSPRPTPSRPARWSWSRCSRRSSTWNAAAWPRARAAWPSGCGVTSFPPTARPMELVRELYAAENEGLADPSGSQDMCGLIYPGVSRLDYDASVEGGWFPCHIESTTDPEVVAWLERVVHLVPLGPRPDGYNPLLTKNLDPAWVARLGAVGHGLL